MNRVKKDVGIYGFFEPAEQPSCEVRFKFDKEIWLLMNRLRVSCPSLEDALTRLPVWMTDDEPLALDLVEVSVWCALEQCFFYFRNGLFDWMEAGSIWRDIEQFAALNFTIGMRMINRFNQLIDIWIKKPVECQTQLDL